MKWKENKISSSETWLYLQIRVCKLSIKSMDTNQFGGIWFDTLQLGRWCKWWTHTVLHCKHKFSVLKHTAMFKCNKAYRARSTEILKSMILAITLIYTSIKLNFRGSLGSEVAQQTVFPHQMLLVNNGYLTHGTKGKLTLLSEGACK